MKPSERITEIYFEMRGGWFDTPEMMNRAILAYLDEEYKKNENNLPEVPK